MTSDEPDMKPLPGVHRPANSSVWHFQKKVPKDLRDPPAIRRQQWAHRGSLGTSSLREANTLAALKLAELESRWTALRASLRVTRPEDVPPALVTASAPAVAPQRAPEGRSKAPDGLTLGQVVASVLADHPDNQFKRKLGTATGHLMDYLGSDVLVVSIKQAQINDFLAKVCRLPANWYQQLRHGKSLAQLLEEEHAECISPTTFESTYKAGLGMRGIQ